MLANVHSHRNIAPASMRKMHERRAGDNGGFRAVDGYIRESESPYPMSSTVALKSTGR